MVFIIATMAFVLCFPTLGSAMTGYSSNVRSYVPDNTGNFVPFSRFGLAAYVVEDGERINRTSPFYVSFPMNGEPISIVNTGFTYPEHYPGDPLFSPSYHDQYPTLINDLLFNRYNPYDGVAMRDFIREKCASFKGSIEDCNMFWLVAFCKKTSEISMIGCNHSFSENR
jgi:hypothetical protein